ncbi:predicted protein [Plenodomus lingam JN3]|uniref:Uncharacterized protein n=1 Tax=Leptosphaeria maculans (strain JN3 / isolate v23.1.3 / race Av1-4-5-6-7-8) TaxID=985895 RepID=M1ZMG2_LEPMJ|nr:predicted protein [Plenodomus lingam JN3]
MHHTGGIPWRKAGCRAVSGLAKTTSQPPLNVSTIV